MAAQAETPFLVLLQADSLAVVPASDADVITALISYGVKFSKSKTPPSRLPERLNLLAGLMWLHAHIDDLPAAWVAASPAQHALLAEALKLDLPVGDASPLWLRAVARRLVGSIAPGATPQKRPVADDDAPLDGQIDRPGDAVPDPQQPPAPKKAKKSAKSSKSARKASPSGSDGDSSSADSVIEIDDAKSPPLARMPDVMGSGAAFRAQVDACCALAWVPSQVFENEVPMAQRRSLWRARTWTTKERDSYDKMIEKQKRLSKRSSRRENLTSVACPHRLSFAFGDDESLDLDATHLAMVCAGERLSDWAGRDGQRAAGAQGRAEYQRLLDELRKAWFPVLAALDANQHIGAPAISSLFDLIEVFLDRRYARYALTLTGRVREDVLANVARQFFEVQVYFLAFDRDLADRAPRREYAQQAVFSGSRYRRLLAPTIACLLDGEGGSLPPDFNPLPSRPAAGGAASGGAGAVNSLQPNVRRGLLKPSAVSFAADTAPSAEPWQPAMPPAPPPAWQPPPWYGLQPAVYNGPGSPAFPGFSQRSTPLSSPDGPPAWGGYAGPATFASPPPAPSFASAPPPAPPAEKKLTFLSQPQHAYITGEDCAVVPPNEVRKPTCGCANKHGPSYRPGPHATWDCAHRYIERHGSCPGFLLNGFKDDSQWDGPNLKRSTKAAWVSFIRTHNLALPLCPGSRAPPFHL